MKHRVATLADIPDDRGYEVVVGSRVIGLFRQGDDIIAIDGLCPHAGGPLSSGHCADGVVMCPWHGWQFELESGRHCSTPQITVERFEVTIDGDDVSIELPD